jgi:hypothetical protein
MTRRKFIKKVLGTFSITFGCICWFGQKVSPRKFVKAVPGKKYPGRVKCLGSFIKQGKWSG